MTNIALPTTTATDTAYFDELCETGLAISKHTDDAQFALGDIANEIETRYGKSDVKEFARRILRSRSSVYEYAQVARYYSPDARIMWLGSPVLSYSHLKRAMKAPTRELTEQWLNDAIDGAWSVDELERHIIAAVTGERLTKLVTLEFVLGNLQEAVRQLDTNLHISEQDNAQIRIVVYRVTTAKEQLS